MGKKRDLEFEEELNKEVRINTRELFNTMEFNWRTICDTMSGYYSYDKNKLEVNLRKISKEEDVDYAKRITVILLSIFTLEGMRDDIKEFVFKGLDGDSYSIDYISKVFKCDASSALLEWAANQYLIVRASEKFEEASDYRKRKLCQLSDFFAKYANKELHDAYLSNMALQAIDELAGGEA